MYARIKCSVQIKLFKTKIASDCARIVMIIVVVVVVVVGRSRSSMKRNDTA